MKRSKFTEEQIAFALKQAEVGTSVEERCAARWVFPTRCSATGRISREALGPSELRRLRQLEGENSKLKRLVADLPLDKAFP